MNQRSLKAHQLKVDSSPPTHHLIMSQTMTDMKFKKINSNGAGVSNKVPMIQIEDYSENEAQTL
jgi:hypothetical protein